MSHDQESPGYNVTVALSPIAQEVLFQLFLHGPTWDGDVVSKSGRDELFDLKLAGRYEGYQFLTLAGVKLALANKLDRKKDKRRRQHSDEIDKYRQIAAIVMPAGQMTQAEAMTQNAQGNVMGLQNGRPTVEGLERLLKPEPTDG